MDSAGQRSHTHKEDAPTRDQPGDPFARASPSSDASASTMETVIRTQLLRMIIRIHPPEAASSRETRGASDVQNGEIAHQRTGCLT